MNDRSDRSETELRAELANLPPALRARLDAAGFDGARLVALAEPLRRRRAGNAAGSTPTPASEAERDQRNRIQGRVEPPRPKDVPDAPGTGTAEHARASAVGLDAIRHGQLALCVLAGGMATRMGGVVKALVEAIDGHTFLELRLRENAVWCERAGRPVPLWLMTSDPTEAPIRAELARLHAPAHVATFTQDLALRLTPEGLLFRGDDGQPSTYAPGHGDLPDALRRSGLLSDFVGGGGKYVWIANLDNLGATIDAALLGSFIESEADVMVEAAPKAPGDRGGIPVWADAPGGARRLQVLEEFRLPRGFDADAVRVFNTNTFLVRAEALLRTPIHYTWFEVEKKVDGRTAVQFERLLQELTAAMPAAYLRVPREGAAARFLPVKDFDELAKRRDEIRAVASARGII